MAKLINFLAGPGAGKSTLAFGLMYELKMRGVNAELAPEFAKQLTWDQRFNTLADQFYILGKQHNKIKMLNDQCDVIVTDGPIILGLLYTPAHYPDDFRRSVKFAFNQYDNVNIFVKRTKDYNPSGRNQTEDEAKVIDDSVLKLLKDEKIHYFETTGDRQGLTNLLDYLKY